jgi:hypothetical protein
MIISSWCIPQSQLHHTFHGFKIRVVCSRYPGFCLTTQKALLPCATKLIFLGTRTLHFLGTTLMFLEFLEPCSILGTMSSFLEPCSILGTTLFSWNSLISIFLSSHISRYLSYLVLFISISTLPLISLSPYYSFTLRKYFYLPHLSSLPPYSSLLHLDYFQNPPLSQFPSPILHT